MNSARRKVLLTAVFFGMVGIYLSLDSRLVTGADSYVETDRAIENFGDAFKELWGTYYKELEPEKLSDAAIQGMLEELDPNTQFYDKRQLDQLRIKTQGKFGGLGISISKKYGDVPVVMGVFDGTPADTAGLLMGDKIIAIHDLPTSGKELQEVVDSLRGDPQQPVVITIERPGLKAPFKQHLIRDRISIKSVGLAAEVEPGIGYVSMSGMLNGHFSESTGKELEDAIRSLNVATLKGLVLDLRGNPGGLLTQAISVADKFLPPNQVVVSTRGRDAAQNQEYRTRERPVADKVPLVVLVDGGSASASEIVAGAIQDSDRGLIIGTSTFGKGSVQTIRPIGPDKALKLTTAVYYTPSGRSIHRSDSQMRRGRRLYITLHDTTRVPVYEAMSLIGQAERREEAITELTERYGITTQDAESLIQQDFGSLVGLGLLEDDNNPKGSDPKEAFKTAGGRTVYGGGGISPDVEVERQRPPRVVIELNRRYLFFDFAVHYAAGKTFPGSFDDFKLPDAAVDQFFTYIADTTNTDGYEYKTVAEYRFHDLERSLADRELTKDEKKALDTLRKAGDLERNRELNEAREIIKHEIEQEVAARVYGDAAKQLVWLRRDEQIAEAVKILKDRGVYAQKLALAGPEN